MSGCAFSRDGPPIGSPHTDMVHRLLEAVVRNPARWCWILVGVITATYAGALIVDWALVDSVWRADEVARCEEVRGACWSVIAARHRIILFGLYPHDQHWRAAAGCGVVVALIILTCVPALWSLTRLALLWIVGFALFVALVRGGVLGISLIPTESWGGLTLTLFIYACVVLMGMPLAVLLALAGKSRLPVYRWVARVAVDTTRSLPFLMILYAAAIIIPIALPRWLHADRLLFIVLGFAFYFACYQSEVVRGGLQTIPKGQYDAGMALGLSYWALMRCVILPQAFRVTLPSTVNELVTAFKETSVIAIVGLFDLTASAHAAYEEGTWNPYYLEVYLFIGVIYFAFAHSLGWYGQYLQARLKRERVTAVPTNGAAA